MDSVTDNSSNNTSHQNSSSSVEMKELAAFKDNSEEWKFEHGGGKVKGFRNWTQSMEVDLIETKANVLKGLFIYNL